MARNLRFQSKRFQSNFLISQRLSRINNFFAGKSFSGNFFAGASLSFGLLAIGAGVIGLSSIGCSGPITKAPVDLVAAVAAETATGEAPETTNGQPQDPAEKKPAASGG